MMLAPYHDRKSEFWLKLFALTVDLGQDMNHAGPRCSHVWRRWFKVRSPKIIANIRVPTLDKS